MEIAICLLIWIIGPSVVVCICHVWIIKVCEMDIVICLWKRIISSYIIVRGYYVVIEYVI